MTTVAAAMTTFLAFLGDCFWLQGLQFKLRNFALTTAWPHAWPLAKTFLGWLLATLATWIVDACSKCDWECHWIATTATASTTATAVMANMRASKPAATIAASTKSWTTSYRRKIKEHVSHISSYAARAKVAKEKKCITRSASYKELPSAIRFIADLSTIRIKKLLTKLPCLWFCQSGRKQPKTWKGKSQQNTHQHKEEKLATSNHSQRSSIQRSFLVKVILFLPPAKDDEDTCKRLKYLRSKCFCSIFVVLLIRIGKALTGVLIRKIKF